MKKTQETRSLVIHNVDRAFIEAMKERAALERRTLKQFIFMACEKALASETVR